MTASDAPIPGACSLDHHGCLVCSDAGIVLQVVEVNGDDALCSDVAGNEIIIAVELVAPVLVGDQLLTHGGVAIGRAPRQFTPGEEHPI